MVLANQYHRENLRFSQSAKIVFVQSVQKTEKPPVFEPVVFCSANHFFVAGSDHSGLHDVHQRTHAKRDDNGADANHFRQCGQLTAGKQECTAAHQNADAVKEDPVKPERTLF